MSLKTIYEQFKILENARSLKVKVQLLRYYMEDPDFLRIIKLTYTKKRTSKARLTRLKHPRQFSNKELLDHLEKVIKKRGVTKLELIRLSEMASVDQETFDVVMWVLTTRLPGKLVPPVINKAVPNTIYTLPYMRHGTMFKLHCIKYPAFAQELTDGIFVVIIVHKHYVEIRKRDNTMVHQLILLTNLFRRLSVSMVFCGYLVVCKNGIDGDKYECGGIIHSCIFKTCPPHKLKHIYFRMYDAIPYNDFNRGECLIPYSTRLKKCKQIVDFFNSKYCQLLETKKVTSERMAFKFYNRMLSQQKNGAVIRNMDMIWRNGDSVDQIKLQRKANIALRIVNYTMGQKGTVKENKLRSLYLESDDGIIYVSVGTGFTTALRELNWEKKIGQVAEITYQFLTPTRKDKNKYTLLVARFKKFLPDCKKTDSIETAQKKSLTY